MIKYIFVALFCFSSFAVFQEPLGLVPIPEELGIAVTIQADKGVYAPGEKLIANFSLSQLVAAEEPLSFYDARAFEDQPFLLFSDPVAFASRLQSLVTGNWGQPGRDFLSTNPRPSCRLGAIPPGRRCGQLIAILA